jgi:tetratricopeptide (TPR) repeat protein
MSNKESPAAQIERLLAAKDFAKAMQLSSWLCATEKSNPWGWMGCARVHFYQGRFALALEDAKAATTLEPNNPNALLLQASILNRLGVGDQSIALLRQLVSMPQPFALEASLALLNSLDRAGRTDELRDFLRLHPALHNEPRATFVINRLLGRTNPQNAIELMVNMAKGNGAMDLRRIAGFDAVRLLDQLGRYQEAFDLALYTHATTTPHFDLEAYLNPARAQLDILSKGKPWFTPTASKVSGVAIVVGLPRSGTTLLEQMLDRHPSITGIGEYEGIRTLSQVFQASPRWPMGLAHLDASTARSLQNGYMQDATLRRENRAWTLDKTLEAWRWIPAIAAVLPGTFFLNISRDPRDTAISIFLNSFNPEIFGWSASLNSIRQVIELECLIVPAALKTLGLLHETIVYENLVANPQDHAKRCLDGMGLPMHDAVLRPQDNTRTVLTLSHEQVRKPIHDASIGRWKNYEWAFNESWDTLAAAHVRRRAACDL